MTPARPSPDQLQTRFTAAERAMLAGRLDEARTVAGEVARALPREPAVLRLIATIERRRGDTLASLAAYRAAIAIARTDWALRLDYGSLLQAMGRFDEAVAEYRRVPKGDPRYQLAAKGLGTALDQMGAHDAAAVSLEAAVAAYPGDADLWQALGAALRSAGELARAASAFDRALRIRPDDPLALLAVARTEQERGLDARPAYARALARAPGRPELRLGQAVASLSMGDVAGAIRDAETLVRDHPTWTEAQSALARMRWQQGDEDGFTRGFEEALAVAQHEGPLWAAYLRALARAGRTVRVYEDAARARAALGRSATLDMIEARAASEAGDVERADRLFEPLLGVDLPEAHLLMLPHWLRYGRPERAAALADRMRRGPHAGLAVPYLGTAWRVLGDPRAAWLEERAGLIVVERLDIDLDALAAVLRRLHMTRNAPLDQSLRGGTQTEGALFVREEPAIRALAEAAAAAVARYVSALPPVEEDHPFLSMPRGPMRFSGSWSVRLTDGGHHVAHVHDQGRVSSAFYVALPHIPAGEEVERDGWLMLGEPPATLGLSLPPLAEVRPEQGKLALFPSTMWHGTRPFAAGERLTAAFDMVPRR
jgi:tetratricopeptide (TPR) repeat protein